MAKKATERILTSIGKCKLTLLPLIKSQLVVSTDHKCARGVNSPRLERVPILMRKTLNTNVGKWIGDRNRHFTDKEIKMAYKFMGKC